VNPTSVNPITARPLTLELYGAPGALEEVALEAAAVFNAPWKPHKFVASVEVARGFVRVKGAAWDLACELTARMGTVHDVRLAFPALKVSDWSEVPATLERYPWDALFDDREPLEIRAEAFPGALGHAGRLRQAVEDFFDARGSRAPRAGEPFTRLEFTAAAQHLRVRVSLGDDALHKRGWRARTGSLATLREDLASSVLVRLGVRDPRASRADHIAVPFAGSGTLGVEAWHALYGLPPAVWGVERAWRRLAHPSAGSQAWWQRRIERAAGECVLPGVTFIERSAAQFDELEANVGVVRSRLEAAGVDVPALRAVHGDAFAVEPELIAPRGAVTLLPLHPPYGVRLAQDADMEALYSRLGRAVDGWAHSAVQGGGALVGCCLCPSEPLWRTFCAELGDLYLETSHVSQGGLDVRVVLFATPE
jgi:23S rRNA G2445 N2-methylase RlmL